MTAAIDITNDSQSVLKQKAVAEMILDQAVSFPLRKMLRYQIIYDALVLVYMYSALFLKPALDDWASRFVMPES